MANLDGRSLASEIPDSLLATRRSFEIELISGSLEDRPRWPKLKCSLPTNATVEHVAATLAEQHAIGRGTKIRVYEEITAPPPFSGTTDNRLTLLRMFGTDGLLRSSSTHLLVLPIVPLSALPLWPQVAPHSSEPLLSQLDRDNKATSPRSPAPSSGAFAPDAQLNKRICLWAGNLVSLEVDAVVNSANEALLGGGGVDGIIHFVAGAELKHVCHAMPGELLYTTPAGIEMRVRCRAGEAKHTAGFGLPARNIIHTVGPYLDEYGKPQPHVLAKCYTSSLDLANSLGLRTVAFPRIATVYYGYPLYDAARVAMRAVRVWLELHSQSSVDRVVFVTGLSANEQAAELMHSAALECFPPS